MSRNPDFPSAAEIGGARPPDLPGTRRDLAMLVRDGLRALVLPVIAFILALITGAVVIWVSEVVVAGGEFDLFAPIEAYVALFQGAVGSYNDIVDTLVLTTPLLLAGLGVGLAFRAGLFNIGATGQFLIGALTAVAVGVAVKDWPAVVAIPVALLAGILGGAAWGFIPGFLKARSGAHEVVTTIMLNFIARYILAAAVSGPLDLGSSPSPITDDVGNAALPIFLGRNGHTGILLALLAALGVHWLLFRMTLGFEIRAVGANPDAARAAGMRPAFITVLTMVIAGALAGAAGAVVILGVSHGNMQASFGTSVGFDAIAVALLGRSSPLGIVFAALLFGAMRAGAGTMQITAGVPRELVDVLQAVVLFFLVATPFLLRRWNIGGGVTSATSETTITKSYGGGTASL